MTIRCEETVERTCKTVARSAASASKSTAPDSQALTCQRRINNSGRAARHQLSHLHDILQSSHAFSAESLEEGSIRLVSQRHVCRCVYKVFAEVESTFGSLVF